jgi:biotin-dependent carboxylase-like uncharacterized protein
MSRLVFSVLLPGMFTTVQDAGRWGFQGKGMPVAGAMDLPAFRLGNILAGNGQLEAGLEITLVGPSLLVEEGEGVVAVTGAELDFRVNGRPVPNWTALLVKTGDVLSFGSPLSGCRAYLCVSGGIDVPAVMGSRSTYIRAKVGGVEGRALKKGDRVQSCDAPPLWRRCEGFECPQELRALYDLSEPLRVIPGPQDDMFTPGGMETFYSSEYVVSNSADRMGYRLDGPKIEHRGAADIISDAIPLGAVQVPGHGQPIVMMSDRQTTGGYSKIGVVSSLDVAALSQRLPGHRVRFERISPEDATALVRRVEWKVSELCRRRATYRSRQLYCQNAALSPELSSEMRSGEFILKVNGQRFAVEWEEC